ncbi:aspartyl-phosphate phosphatase Spo0E family protein [Bacillus wiedmannii]|nr:aspartyl-phosphate phosphatase Spo0E family protein [Bacillus wiedmannii]
MEEKKKQLRHLVKVYEYTDPILLACSEELDQFLGSVAKFSKLL